jgi:hypothetical protein
LAFGNRDSEIDMTKKNSRKHEFFFPPLRNEAPQSLTKNLL